MSSEATKHGWYSAKAEKVLGHVMYKTPTGDEVKVTNVTFDKEGILCKWPDRQYVGLVTEPIKEEQSQETPPGLADEDIDMELIRQAFSEVLMALENSSVIFLDHATRLDSAYRAILLQNDALNIQLKQNARFLKMINILEERIKKLETQKPIRGKPSEN